MSTNGAMSHKSRPTQSRWLSGLGQRVGFWQADEQDYAALLDALTRDRLSVEALEREMDARSRRSLADVQEEQRRAEHEEIDEARRELRDFRTAMEDLRARSGPDGRSEAAFDSADPLHDAQADLLIQYLVRPGYADVRTDEPEPGHYVYYLKVDWDRLRTLATEAGRPIAF